MTKYLILYIASAVIFFPLDFLWLSTMGKSFYKPELGSLMLDSPNLVVAGLFYLAYLVGVVILVSAPAEGDILKALLMGAVLGFVAYGTYDLTNLSTMAGFSPRSQSSTWPGAPCSPPSARPAASGSPSFSPDYSVPGSVMTGGLVVLRIRSRAITTSPATTMITAPISEIPSIQCPKITALKKIAQGREK